MSLAEKEMPGWDWAIRRAQEKDIEAMLSFWSGIKEIQSATHDSPALVQGCLKANPGSCLVAYAGAVLVGTVLGTYDGWRGGIYHLAVHPEYRRQGLGEALLEQALKVLRQRGAPRVDLTTYVYNERAQAFYRKYGWRERSEVKSFSFEYLQQRD